MDDSKTVEEWAEDKKTPRWLVAATRAFKGWPVGKELSESDFDNALTEAGAITLRPIPQQGN